MTTSSDGNGHRPLDNLGISEAEERVYRWLLKHRNSSVSEAAREMSLAPDKTQHLLETLEAKGLATHSPEVPRRYHPVSPDMALRVLIAQRRKELQEAEFVLEELQNEADSEQTDEREQILEVITSPEMERQAYNQMSRMAQHEVLHLSKPPLIITELDAAAREDAADQYEARERGVHYRSVADSEFVGSSEAMKRIREEAESGEDVRVYPDLPFKMVICDRKMAFIPLQLDNPNSSCLLAKSSALLDALCQLFEFIWRNATPLRLVGTDEAKITNEGNQLDNKTRDLIALMAAGLNDKSIYMELGVSRRTHQTRVSNLLHVLNARTRFQAGWRAARLFPDNDK